MSFLIILKNKWWKISLKECCRMRRPLPSNKINAHSTDSTPPSFPWGRDHEIRFESVLAYIGKLLLELDDGPELGLGVGAVGAEELGDVDHVVVVGGQVLLGLEVQEVVPAGQTQLHLV